MTVNGKALKRLQSTQCRGSVACPVRCFRQRIDSLRRGWFAQEADDLLFGRTLLHVQSPSCGGLNSKPGRYSNPGGRRFGNLKNVYDRVGYKPPRNLEYQNRRRAAAPWLASVIGVARKVIESVGAVTAAQGATLTVDRSWSLSFSIICPSMMLDGQLRWPIRQLPSGPADIFVFVRMDAAAHHPIDYVVAPRAAFEAWPQAFYEHDCPITGAYLFSSLAILRRLAICSRAADVP